MPREKSELSERIVALWEEGKTCVQIAEEIGDAAVTRRQVRRCLVRLDLSLHRERAERRRFDRGDIDLRSCSGPNCTNILMPLPDESPSKYAQRTTCGPECKKARRAELAAQYLSGPRAPRGADRALEPPVSGAGAEVRQPAPPSPPRPVDRQPPEGQIEEFLRTRGVTRCPTKFAAPTAQAALCGAAAKEAIGQVEVENRAWNHRRSPYFGTGRRGDVAIGMPL